MNISANYDSTNFKAKFVNNAAFKEVVDYAANTKKLRELDNALHNLKSANEGDILIIHGKTPAGIYSSFRMSHRSVQNLSMGAETPAESSFNAIIDLSSLGRKFKKLVGAEVKTTVTAEDIIKNYAV